MIPSILLATVVVLGNKVPTDLHCETGHPGIHHSYITAHYRRKQGCVRPSNRVEVERDPTHSPFVRLHCCTTVWGWGGHFERRTFRVNARLFTYRQGSLYAVVVFGIALSNLLSAFSLLPQPFQSPPCQNTQANRFHKHLLCSNHERLNCSRLARLFQMDGYSTSWCVLYDRQYLAQIHIQLLLFSSSLLTFYFFFIQQDKIS